MTVGSLIHLEVSLFLPDTNLATLHGFRSLPAQKAQGFVGRSASWNGTDRDVRGGPSAGRAGVGGAHTTRKSHPAESQMCPL